LEAAAACAEEILLGWLLHGSGRKKKTQEPDEKQIELEHVGGGFWRRLGNQKIGILIEMRWGEEGWGFLGEEEGD
jgi:hypothetical protein